MGRLRILMYSRYFPPEYSGAALQALCLARELRRRGNTVEFITQRWPGLPARDEVEGFAVTRLESGRGRKHQELRLWWNLYRFLRRRQGDFDILHSHGAYYTDSILGPLGRWFGKRSLVKASLADNDLHDLGRTVSGRIHLAMLRRVDACIAISPDLEQEFIVGGVAPERVVYLPNSVDLERFAPASAAARRALRERLGLPLEGTLALYVGVFDARKNIGWLAEQWLARNGFGTGARLVAVGPTSRDDAGGAFKQGLRELAAAHPDLMWIGDEVPNVEDYLRAADLFVLPSKSEGLPNAVLEAMACGLPCVAADIGGTRDLVQHGRTGYLFRLNDPESLARAMTKLTQDDLSRLGAAARRVVEEGFSVSDLAEKYEDICRQLTGRAAKG